MATLSVQPAATLEHIFRLAAYVLVFLMLRDPRLEFSQQTLLAGCADPRHCLARSAARNRAGSSRRRQRHRQRDLSEPQPLCRPACNDAAVYCCRRGGGLQKWKIEVRDAGGSRDRGLRAARRCRHAAGRNPVLAFAHGIPCGARWAGCFRRRGRQRRKTGLAYLGPRFLTLLLVSALAFVFPAHGSAHRALCGSGRHGRHIRRHTRAGLGRYASPDRSLPGFSVAVWGQL